MQYIYDKKGVLTPTIFPEVPGFGVQIPANGIEIEEELTDKDGYVWLYKDNKIVQVKDNRGIYYSKETGEEIEYKEYGDLPDTLTKKEPSTPYDKWDGKKWVKDEQAELEDLKQQAIVKINSLLVVATQRIEPLQDAVDLDMATDEEIASLKAWKTYRVTLNRVESQDNFPQEINWPLTPTD